MEDMLCASHFVLTSGPAVEDSIVEKNMDVEQAISIRIHTLFI